VERLYSKDNLSRLKRILRTVDVLMLRMNSWEDRAVDRDDLLIA